MKNLNLKRKETKFLLNLAISEGVENIKHPVFGALMGQVTKLLVIIDSDDEKIAKVKHILDRVKEEWNGD